MLKFKSLNGRLLFAFSTLSIIVCLFFIRFTALIIETAELNAYESLLVAQSQSLKNRESVANLILTSPDSAYFNLYDKDSVIPNWIKAKIRDKEAGQFIDDQGDHYLFQNAINASGDELVLLLNISSIQANKHLSDFKSLFLFSISASVSVLCLLSSWYLAKWLSTPIRKLTQDIELRTQGSQESLFGLNRKDEIGTLANALEQSYGKIQALLKREQNFTRDVSHELRTPITLIKNTIALSPSNTLDLEATKVVSQASKELEQTVEVLLALARQENLQFVVQPVLPIIEKTVLNIYNIYPDLDFDVKINVDPKLLVTGNQYLISLLCQNLVNNGFYHSNSGEMRVSSNSQSLIFENKIAGSNHRPYYQGLGHGQYLVNRIVEEMGWQLSINQTEDSYVVIVKIV
ncbi:MAG: histidine kinase dimerization/phospho-acceptor domain-containing protein [Paraglaciecola sp.]|uniref:histidine kinase dimerization/phospho-acceptor domain-containing protein n=1 Tax=Paraglaciecola sp. TaxID=1920173 RepID=UPI0032968F0E